MEVRRIEIQFEKGDNIKGVTNYLEDRGILYEISSGMWYDFVIINVTREQWRQLKKDLNLVVRSIFVMAAK